MFLLNEYKNRKIHVAHVNYNLRKDSKNDEGIVKDFCKEHKIPYDVLVVKEKPKGNTEAWARDIRYKFFKKIYEKVGAKALYTGHHRDDFLETAIMQQESGRVPRYFGIRYKTNIYDMNVVRPYIDLYWKSEILLRLKSIDVEYAVDSTNSNTDLTRNKVRAELAKLPVKEKHLRVSWFKMSNKILKKKFKRVDKNYLKWEVSGFDSNVFREFSKDKPEIAFVYLNKYFENIKLSKGKIESIIDFIESKDGGKKFKLNDKVSLTKTKNKLREA